MPVSQWPESPRSILVRAPNWIGDQCLAFPFFFFLRRAFPKAKITSVCVPWVRDIQFRDLVDEVKILQVDSKNSSLFSRFLSLDRLARSLRSQWDAGISLPDSFSAAWLLHRSGCRVRRGFGGDGRSFLLNDRVFAPAGQFLHRAEAYCRLLPGRAPVPGNFFWGVPPENDLDEGLPGVLLQFDAMTSWKPENTVTPPPEPYWIVAPGATAESRRWPVECFSVLADLVYQKTGWRALVVGGPKEAPLAEILQRSSRAKIFDFTARGPVSSLWALFRGARFTLTNESGLAHVASLCGSSVQIVCGAADPRRTKPIGPGRVEVTVNAVECWPCEKNTCFQPPERRIQCLKGIDPEAVWDEIQKGLLAPTAKEL